jgi:hypothetical protein
MPALAKVEWVETAELIREATLIVHGHVVKLDEIDLGSWPSRPGAAAAPVTVATLRVDDVVKGALAGPEVRVVASRLALDDQTQLTLGREYVLMLAHLVAPGGERVEDLHRVVYYGISGSIASPAGPGAGDAAPRPLEFYYRTEPSGPLHNRTYPDVAAFIRAVRETMVAQESSSPR